NRNYTWSNRNARTRDIRAPARSRRFARWRRMQMPRQTKGDASRPPSRSSVLATPTVNDGPSLLFRRACKLSAPITTTSEAPPHARNPARFLVRIRIDLFLSRRDAHSRAGGAGRRHRAMAAVYARTDFPGAGLG